MSYTRPAYNAADASWIGAPVYFRPAYNAADASWYEALHPPPIEAGDWITGSHIVILLYPETTYATPPTGAAPLRAAFAAWSVTPSATLRTIDILSTGRTPLTARTASTLSGTVETTLAPETLGWWLYQTLGGLTTTGTGPYIHTFTPGRLPTGFTAEKVYPAAHGYERQSGIKVASAVFSFSPGEPSRLSLTLQGARQTLADTPLGTTPDAPGHADWSGLDITLAQDGTALGTVTAVTLSIDNALSGAALSMLGKPCGIPAGRVKLTARLQAVLTDLAWLEQALAGTATSFSLTILHGSGDGTTGNESLVLILGDCRINPFSPAIDTESGLIADLSLQIGALTATLRNSLSSVLP